jgi:hypothetical protein
MFRQGLLLYPGTPVARPARTTILAPGGDGSQLTPEVRPVLGDHCLVGKSPNGLAAGCIGLQPMRPS